MIQWPTPYTNTKYGQWYDNLIEKAKIRGWGKKSEMYVEAHHIIPRSMGGNDHKDNLVCLTAREHYIAHALLWKMGFNGIHGSKMSYAFNTFMNNMNPLSRPAIKINSRIYEAFRVHYAEMLSKEKSGINNHFYGKTHTEETRRIIGEKSKLKEFKSGPDNPNWGKPSKVTPAGKARQVAAIRSRWADPHFREEMCQKRKAYFQTPDGIAQRQATSDRVKGKPATPEQMKGILKIAESRKGKTWEELYTPDQLEKYKTASSRRVFTEEGKARLIESSREVGKRPKSENFKKLMSERMTGIKRATVICEHCGIECVLCNYNRWHGNNCKHKL